MENTKSWTTNLKQKYRSLVTKTPRCLHTTVKRCTHCFHIQIKIFHRTIKNHFEITLKSYWNFQAGGSNSLNCLIPIEGVFPMHLYYEHPHLTSATVIIIKSRIADSNISWSNVLILNGDGVMFCISWRCTESINFKHLK